MSKDEMAQQNEHTTATNASGSAIMSKEEVSTFKPNTDLRKSQNRNTNITKETTETELASPKKKKPNGNDPPLTINILYTQYEIMEEVAQELGFRTSIDEEADWDVWFIDGPTIPALLVKMKNY